MNMLMMKTLSGMAGRKGVTGLAHVLLGMWIMVNFPDAVPPELKEQLKIGGILGWAILMALSWGWSMKREESTKGLHWKYFVQFMKDKLRENGKRVHK